MKKLFEAVKKFVGLGIFLISLLLISSYIYAVYPANNLALNNNLMKDISPHISKAYALVPIGDTGGFGGGGIPIHYTVSTAQVNGIYGTISPGYISSIAPSNVVTFSVVPNSGYGASATGCGGSLSGTTYTTGAIYSNCTVTATFRALPPTVIYFYPSFKKVDMGAKPVLKWNISNFSSCTITSPAITGVQGSFNHSFSKSQSVGSKVASKIYAPTTYTLKCDTNPATSPFPTLGYCSGSNQIIKACSDFTNRFDCLDNHNLYGCVWNTK